MRSVQRIGLAIGFSVLAVMSLSFHGTAVAANSERTPQEAFAAAYSKMQSSDAAMMAAQAQWIQTLYNVRKMAAETAKMIEDLRAARMDNEVKTCETFYKKRERNDAYRAKHPRVRPDHETYVRVCNATKPSRLPKYQFDPDRNKINWPRLLQRPEFEQRRQELDALFQMRSTGSAGSVMDFEHKVDKLSRQIRAELCGMVRQVNQMEYASAKNFVRGLALEARSLPQLQSVAAN